MKNHPEIFENMSYNVPRKIILLLFLFINFIPIFSNENIYTLTVTSYEDHGYADHDGEHIRNGSQDFSVKYGDSFSITAIPDEGYRVVKIVQYREGWGGSVSEYADTSSENHFFSAGNIKENRKIEVYFEKIPEEQPSYTLTVTSYEDHGYADHDGEHIRNGSQDFSVKYGDSFSITAIPDEGYRVVKIVQYREGWGGSVSEYADTSSENHFFSAGSIKENRKIEVYFEKIPEEQPSYTLTVTSYEDHGYADHDGEHIRNGSQDFSVKYGDSFSITAIPDEGYRVVKIVQYREGWGGSVSEYADTSSENHFFSAGSIKENRKIEVYFEKIPEEQPSYTLTIMATGNGFATYNGVLTKNNTQAYILNEGTSTTITFTPDAGYRIKNVKVNSTDVTSKVSNNSYTISSISANTTVEVVFEAIPIPTYTLSITASGNGSVYLIAGRVPRIIRRRLR